MTRTSEIQSDKGIRHSLAALLTTITLLHDPYIVFRQSLTALSIGSYIKYMHNKVKVLGLIVKLILFLNLLRRRGRGWGGGWRPGLVALGLFLLLLLLLLLLLFEGGGGDLP